MSYNYNRRASLFNYYYHVYREAYTYNQHFYRILYNILDNRMDITTEKDSYHDNLEQMTVSDILQHINKLDHTVPEAVAKALPQIEALAIATAAKMKAGGRLFYIGAGTSGRLGVVDASECPPTFGVPFDMVVGLIAGGDGAIRRAVEFAEDDAEQAWKDLAEYRINDKDILVGIAASGTTPYVIGGLKTANRHNITTGCIVCNSGSPVAAEAKYPVEVVTGPEFLTGSTRMKAGTAQKLVLNMLSTCVMIQIGRVKGNKMVDMQLTNNKLVNRGTRMVMNQTGLDENTAAGLLKEHGSVRKAVDSYKEMN
jgi:N-acetylmuramic acid 6-phosphate etherase